MALGLSVHGASALWCRAVAPTAPAAHPNPHTPLNTQYRQYCTVRNIPPKRHKNF